MRIVGRLKSRQAVNARPPKGKPSILLPDGGNLYLQATRGNKGHIRRSWVFKFQLAGLRREMGLGPLHTINLATARDKARKLRELLLDGIDPLQEKKRARQELIKARAKTITFEEVARAYFDLHQAGWKNAQHRQQWLSSLERYAFPRIGKLAPADIDQPLVFGIVEPIWRTKTETASRVLNRIGVVLDYATTRGYRSGDNPARHVRKALPKTATIAKVENFPALPYADMPTFMAELRGRTSIAALPLEMQILCASRPSEILGALWPEIDFGAKVWRIPAERMKEERPHTVPLSDRVLEILRGLPQDGERIFSIGDSTMRRLLGSMRPPAIASVHGFRSSFRDWALERTSFPDHVVELCLAHAVGSDTERRYKRGTLLEKRRTLMAAWANYCCRPTVSGAVVVPLRKVDAHA
jgi:integrase